jgi:hypothetical protein
MRGTFRLEETGREVDRRVRLSLVSKLVSSEKGRGRRRPGEESRRI